MRAAVRGLIDYSKADVFDPAWQRRHRILLRSMAREDDLQVCRCIFDYYRALVANSGLTGDSFKSVQQKAVDAFYDILNVLRPWEALTSQERKAKSGKDLRAAWFKAFNVDSDDPDWEEKNKRSIDAWVAEREQQKAEAPEDPEDTLRRRQAARDQRLLERSRAAGTR